MASRTGFVARRKWWEKLIGLASCLPIALLCNTIRLTLTAVAFTILERGQWEKLFHDFGGFAMMPLALALIILELWILAKMVIYPAEQKQQALPLPFSRTSFFLPLVNRLFIQIRQG